MLTHVEGYVNAVGRDSRPLPSARKICRAGRAGYLPPSNSGKKPAVMINHKRVLNAEAEFNEDNIGLHVSADIQDSEVTAAARRGTSRMVVRLFRQSRRRIVG